MCIESKCVFNVETNVPTLTLSTSLTSLFKLQTRRTCQQWPQGNDKTVLCCLLAGGNKKTQQKPTKNRKSHATSPLVSLAMPQSHCERPCVSVQGLLILCLALNSRGGTQGRSLPSQITATLCAAHSAHVVVVVALWHFDRVNVLVLIINMAEMEAIFSIFPQITESSPTEREEREKEEEEEGKTFDGRRVESLKVNTWSGSPL